MVAKLDCDKIGRIADAVAGLSSRFDAMRADAMSKIGKIMASEAHKAMGKGPQEKKAVEPSLAEAKAKKAEEKKLTMGAFSGIDCDKIGRIADSVTRISARFDAMIDRRDAVDPDKEDYPERYFNRTVNTYKGSRLAEQVQKKSGSLLDMRYFTPHELQGMIKTAAAANRK